MIDLPWPDKALSPNSTAHWGTKSRAKAKARRDSYFATQSAFPTGIDGEAIALSLTFYPPDTSRRDDDNLIGSFKAYRDGIADALGIDDTHFHLRAVHIAEPVARGRINVILTVIHPDDKTDVAA